MLQQFVNEILGLSRVLQPCGRRVDAVEVRTEADMPFAAQRAQMVDMADQVRDRDRTRLGNSGSALSGCSFNRTNSG